MKAPSSLARSLTLALALAAGACLAHAKSVPRDAAMPVVELMPLTMKHEADLKLSAEQIKSLEDFRKIAMPGRLATQKRILDLRAQLRMAILDNKPQAERDALMTRIADDEVAHMKGRNTCVETLRMILTAEQFAELKRLYLSGLR
jgi:hypothetical protein